MGLSRACRGPGLRIARRIFVRRHGLFGASAITAITLLASSAGPSKAGSVVTGHTNVGGPISSFSLQSLPSAPRVGTALFSLTPDLQGVGQQVSSSSSDPIYFDGHTAHDLTGQLGHGYLISIDSRHDATGTVNGFPVYWHPGQAPIILNFPGEGRAVTLGPVVAVTTQDSLGAYQSQLWAPKTGKEIPIGSGRVGGMNALYTVVGGANDAHAWYAMPNGRGGFQQHELPFGGYLRGVNANNWGYGYRFQNGGPIPIGIQLSNAPHPSFPVDYKLSKGLSFGSVARVNVGGVAVVNEFKNLAALQANQSVPVIYFNNPNHPIRLDSLKIFHLPSGAQLTSLNYITDNNILTGNMNLHSTEFADILTPKLVNKQVGAFFELIGFGGGVPARIRRDLGTQLDRIGHDLTTGARASACQRINKLSNDLQEVRHSLGLRLDPFASLEDDFYDNFIDIFKELDGELQCRRMLHAHPLDPRPMQTPFPVLLKVR